MKYLLHIIIISFLFSIFSFAQLTVKDQESTPNTLLQINDEGTAGSITFPNVGTKLSGLKLYNYGNNLYWGGYQLGLAQTAGGWTDFGPIIYTSTSTDKIGIGTTNPQSMLSVGGEGNTNYAI